MDTVKIAFGYQAGVGKNEATNLLLSKIGGIELSFAQPLYDILYFAQQTCGFPLKKDRQFLQYIGTEWARKQNENVWVDKMERSITENIDKNIIISDVRFKNEFDFLKQNGFIMVKIIRENRDINSRIGTGDSSHSSEKNLEEEGDWDYIVENNGTINIFHAKIISILEKIN